MYRPVRHCLLLMFAGATLLLPAQTVTDSTNIYLNLLSEMAQAGNFEQAQVESENFRAFLRRAQVFCPAQAIPVLSGIYRHNQDEESALAFLGEAARDARRDQNPETRAALLLALVKAYSEWEQSEHADACEKLLAIAQDSLNERAHRLAIRDMQHRMDSLVQLRRLEIADQSQYYRIERERAYLLAGAVLLIFFGMFMANWKSNRRWKKRLAKKDLEIEFIRSDRYASTLQVEPVAVETTEAANPAFRRESYFPPDGKRADKTALLIEPNRQIVLYLKSLLSDRFEVETARSASEGLQMASAQMPDLIVCDAVLNGQTGIDVVRQLKLAERTNHIPVILLTEHFGNEGKLDALRAGADAWFSRPVLDNVFDNEVSRLLESRKTNHEQFARYLHLFFSENRLALDNPFLSRTVQFIDENLSDPDFMADDLARKMQMHKQHYFKKLQVLTGKEPIQLIREMRLEKAKVLLEKRAGTPQAIAELVGFASTGSFALAFKEYFGENTSLLQMPDRRQ